MDSKSNCNEDIKATFKFIGLGNLKGEHTIIGKLDDKIIEVIKELKLLYNDSLPSIETVSITYKAKKIDILKTFMDLEIKDEYKFNLCKGVENSDISDYLKGIKSENSKKEKVVINHEGSIIQNNKLNAIKTLLDMGYKEDLINTVINSTNKEYLIQGPEVIVEKSLILLKSMIKDNIKPEEYFLHPKQEFEKDNEDKENDNKQIFLISNNSSVKSKYKIDFNGTNIS